MKPAALSLVFALAAGSALAAANPLSDALSANAGALCYTRSYDAAWLKAHRGQTVTRVTLSLARDGTWDEPTLRLKADSRAGSLLVFGGCDYLSQGINRGVSDNILDPTFKPNSGLSCYAVTDVTGASAEEGGDFFIDWADGRTIELHLPDSVGAWKSYDTRHYAKFANVRAQDRIIRLTRADASACGELRARFAPAAP